MYKRAPPNVEQRRDGARRREQSTPSQSIARVVGEATRLVGERRVEEARDRRELRVAFDANAIDFIVATEGAIGERIGVGRSWLVLDDARMKGANRRKSNLKPKDSDRRRLSRRSNLHAAAKDRENSS